MGEQTSEIIDSNCNNERSDDIFVSSATLIGTGGILAAGMINALADQTHVSKAMEAGRIGVLIAGTSMCVGGIAIAVDYLRSRS